MTNTTQSTTASSERLFGTDGVRGEAGKPPLDPETVESLGFILADVLIRDRNDPSPNLVVGWDGRESGPSIVASLDAGFRRRGGRVSFAGLLPTPGVAYLARVTGAAAGISVSASHNPYHDNGIKIFSASGEKLPNGEEGEIEERVLAGRERRPGGFTDSGPLLASDPGLHSRYERFLSDSDGNPDLRGLTILVDAANGAASRVAPELFESLGARVIADAVSPDGRNINDGVGALHPDRLSKRVVETSADFGVALDGDADRLVMADASGGIWDGDDLMYLCANDLRGAGTLEPSIVVATVMSNFALESALSKIDVRLVRTAVGDKNVWTEMTKLGARVGGEQSGHLIFRPESTTGDGLLAALRVAAIVVSSGKPLATHRALVKLPQLMKNVRVAKRVPFERVPPIAAEIASAERHLAGRGRVLVRYSGTEPLVRVMAEGENPSDVERVVLGIAQRIEENLGNGSSASWS